MTKQKDKIEITQYLRPNGRKTLVYANVGEKHAKMVEEKQLVISCELLSTDMVAIYIKQQDQSDEEEKTFLARNSPRGKNSPVEVLKRSIEDF